MNTFGTMLGCCNIYNKTYKMSDIEIKKVKNENENQTYLYSEKNTHMNRNLSTSNNNINQPINLTYNTLNINIIETTQKMMKKTKEVEAFQRIFKILFTKELFRIIIVMIIFQNKIMD